MFSGIIEEFATVVAIKRDRDNIDFTLRCSFVDELGIDQSVSHNGVCLTVVSIENGTFLHLNTRMTQRWHVTVISRSTKVQCLSTVFP